MPNRLQKVPITVYVPAVTAIPSRAAYCVTQRVISGYKQSTGGSDYGGYRVVYVPPDPLTMSPGSYTSLPNFGGYGGVGGSIYTGSPLTPTYRNVQTCYPAVVGRAAKPARIDYYANAGWNAGARSVEAVPDNARFRCVVPTSPVAVMVGLTDRAFNHTYGYMSHAMVVRQAGYTIVERGVAKKPETSVPPGATIQIDRIGGVVHYRVNDALVYTSESLSAGDVYAGALLYSLNDYVEDAEIESLGISVRFSGRLPKIRALISDTSRMYVDAEPPAYRLSAILKRVRGLISFDGTLPALVSLASDRAIALADVSIPPLRLAATLGRPERVPSQVWGLVPAITLSAQLRSGKTGQTDATMPAVLSLIGDRPLVMVNVSLPIRVAIQATPAYMPPGEIDGSDVLISADRAEIQTALLLLAMDSLDVASTTAELTFLLELIGMDSLQVSDESSLGAIVELLAMERVAINSSTSAAQKQALQYAVNIATGALTTYQGYDFLGFTTAGGETYAYKRDGVYRLGAATDNGELVSALLDFGTTDFSSNHVKRGEYAYLGLRTDGQCFLRVAIDAGEERVYRVRGNENVKRSQLAKGLSGRHWTLKLELVDASFAEVDSIELSIGATRRRGFGSRN